MIFIFAHIIEHILTLFLCPVPGIGIHMKYSIIAIISLAFFIGFSAAPPPKKEFEGIITYVTTVESKTPDFSNTMVQNAYGDIMTLYYKNGNYKMVFNGDDIRAIYYLRSKNTMYTVRKGIDTLFASPCDAEPRPLVSSVYKVNAEVILKRKCDQVVNDLGEVKNFYWFDPSLYVDPAHFKQHLFGHVNVYFEKARSFWIKYKFEAPLLHVTHTATKIKRTRLPDNTFELPAFPGKQ